MFCEKCGVEVKETDRFCPACGARLTPPEVKEEISLPVFAMVNEHTTENEVSDFRPVLQDKAPAEMSPELKPKSKKKPFLIAAVSLLLVVVITLSAIFIPPLLNEDTPSDQTGTNSSENGGESVLPEDISRTIMIYVVGSNLESQYNAASNDIEEMLDADFDIEKNNLLLCTGGASEWKNPEISADETSFFLVGEDKITHLDSASNESMCESETLTEFLEYGKENYPADRYSLILWNHGGGPMLGYGLDEVHGGMLSLTGLQQALDDSPFSKNEKLELLGFDACLMGTVETAWVFKNYAEFFVASQETEPGDGWNYDFLNELDKCANGGELGQAIVDSYFEFYEEQFEQKPYLESEITLSCMDLSKIDAVEKGIDALFFDLNSEISDGKIRTASRMRYKAKAFGKFASGTQFDLIDLGHITELLSDDYESHAEALEEALGDFIVCSRSNVKNANGISIYHPYDNLYYASSWIKQFKKFDFADGYADYIEEFADAIEGNSGSSGSYRNFSKTAGLAEDNGQASDLSITLTPEQVESFSAAQYYIFKRLSPDETFSGEEEYLHIFSGQDANLSADGKLTATYEGKAVFGKNTATGEITDDPLSMYQIYDGTGEEKFYFPCMFWHFGEGLDMDLEPVNWLMRIKNGKPQLLGAYSMDSEKTDLFPDKYLMNSEDYEIYTFANNSYTTQADGDGNVQFVFTGSSYGYEFKKEEGFSLELLPLNNKSEYYAVFIVEDIYGNSYTSDFFPLG